MKFLKTIIASLLLMTAAAGSAWADHGHYGGHSRSHVFLGFNFGPYWGPGYYPPPVYYYPPVVVQQAPPVYIEQSQPAPVPDASYWYYCPAAKRYYPYVRECPSGWQQVAPTPPGP